nr:UDP-N-acetylmuramate dehydrogenase [Paenibacillus nasutitermitis]
MIRLFNDVSAAVTEGFLLKTVTTMGVGGPCDYYIVPSTIEEIKSVSDICSEKEIPLLVIGNGSNILVDDSGFRGVVLHVGKGMRKFQIENNVLQAEAGVPVPRIAFHMAKEGRAGFEFMAGIPGTVGGAVVMNAGCLNKETSSILQSVTYLDSDGKVQTKSKEELELRFRSSYFLGRHHIILSAAFDASTLGDTEEVMRNTKAAADIRKGKFPINVATVGSTFKSPPEGPHPGRLIEETGLKGYRIGGAEISSVHANWIINKGEATADDVKKLMEIMQNTVAKQFGIELEPEVLFI